MSAIVGNELSRYNIDIAAFSETCFADTGDLTEHGAGYTYFWSGKKLTEPRETLQSAQNLSRCLKPYPKVSVTG